jgi:hypothetical protein
MIIQKLYDLYIQLQLTSPSISSGLFLSEGLTEVNTINSEHR